MRENRTYGSEGGEGKPFPTPINVSLDASGRVALHVGVWREVFRAAHGHMGEDARGLARVVGVFDNGFEVGHQCAAERGQRDVRFALKQCPTELPFEGGDGIGQ